MTSTKDLRDDEILRFLRFSVTESAAATYTEVSYDTQLSIDRGLIWLIHFIQIEMLGSALDDPAAGAGENLKVQIAREGQSDIVNYSDADLIELAVMEIDRSAAVGTDAGPMYWLSNSPKTFVYAPPLAYAAQNIYIGVKSSSGSAQTAYGRIGYTLRRVTDKFFYRVAQALIS